MGVAATPPSPMIVGLMSTYREGTLAMGALRSLLPAVDAVFILDGHVEGVQPSNDNATPTEQMQALAPDKVHVHTRIPKGAPWRDDADKRNAALRWAKQEGAEWAVWLDGDEVLLWGEYLRDMTALADETTGAGGFPLRIVELDGSVAYSYGRVFRPRQIRKFLIGSSQAELHNGVVVGLPNMPICGAGGIPVHPDGVWQPGQMTPEEQGAWLARARPPVAGEPHVLHRAALRLRSRGMERQHVAEGRAFDEQLKPPGL